MTIFRRLGLLNKNQRGFTLIEMLIVLAISSFVTGTTTMTIFQVLDGNVRTNNQMEAISRVQDAGYQVSQDAEQAQTIVRTEDEDGFPLTLSWTDWENNDQHEVIYSIANNKLQRQHYINGGLSGTSYVFEYIFNTDPDTGELKTYCTLIDDTLSCTLTAIVGSGSQKQTETRVYEVIPRPKM
jgi:prepilin-type N-terminal cleavage/methylation domain-containing protein